LKVVLMCAWPMAMFFLTLRRVRPRVAACLLGGATLLRLRLAAADGLLRALASPGVRLRALPVGRQPAPMAKAAIRADLGEPLDRLLALAAKVALDLELGVDVVAELRDLVVGEVADLRVEREAERGSDLARRRLANAVDVCQPDLEPLLVGQVDPRDSGHGELALPLLVAGIRADDQERAVPLDDAAAFAHGLDRRTDLHRRNDSNRGIRHARQSRFRLISVAKRLRPSSGSGAPRR